ncbi:MAG TPA: 50S ribosomal protein L2 [Candidatus Nanoarchaeia archaeon]|nr:50S ribosomal protein L2 [Candidatus Nanoarchaeia archaeon]
MGKNITSQKRGTGSPTFRRPSFSFEGATKIGKNGTAVITELLDCRAHSAPLARVKYDDNTTSLIIAPEGMRKGQAIEVGGKEVKIGNILELKEIPEGVSVFNIENRPGDGGKFVKASGVAAKVIAKTKNTVTLLLPSKKYKEFNPNCRACVGIVAGGGRLEKPLYKAGRKYFAMKAKNQYWPSVSGTSMNAVDHPFGGRSSHHKGRPTIAPKNAPPGKKVGAIRPRHTGRNK